MTRSSRCSVHRPGSGSRRFQTARADVPSGWRVDRFDEEHILSRPEFATVAAQFRATGVVDLEVLLDASAQFVASALAYDLVVTDTLYPFVPSLAWGHDEAMIRSFLALLHTILEPLQPVIVYLDGEPADALPRAASRSGDAWLHAFLAKVSTYKTVPPVEGLARRRRASASRTRRTLRAMAQTGFVVVVLRDAHTRSADGLAADAREQLDALT